MAATDPRKVDRFVQLVALGVTTAEASRAVEFSVRTGERLVQKPDIRKRIEEAQKPDVVGTVGDVVLDALNATRTDKEGHEVPDIDRREWAVEQIAKHGAASLGLEDDDTDDALPDGVILVYPKPGQVPDEDDDDATE